MTGCSDLNRCGPPIDSCWNAWPVGGGIIRSCDVAEVGATLLEEV